MLESLLCMNTILALTVLSLSSVRVIWVSCWIRCCQLLNQLMHNSCFMKKNVKSAVVSWCKTAAFVKKFVKSADTYCWIWIQLNQTADLCSADFEDQQNISWPDVSAFIITEFSWWISMQLTFADNNSWLFLNQLIFMKAADYELNYDVKTADKVKKVDFSRKISSIFPTNCLPIWLIDSLRNQIT